MCCMLTASAADWPIKILGHQITDNYTTVEGITVTKEEGNAYRVTIPADDQYDTMLTTNQHVIFYTGDGDLQVVFNGKWSRHIVTSGWFIADHGETSHNIYIMGYDPDGGERTTGAIIETELAGISLNNVQNITINNFDEFRLLSQSCSIDVGMTLIPMNLNIAEISGVEGLFTTRAANVLPIEDVKIYDDQWNELTCVRNSPNSKNYYFYYSDGTRYDGNEMYFSSYKENDRINRYSNFYGVKVNGKWVNMLNYNHVLGFGDNRIRAINHYEAWNNNICLEMEGGTYDLKKGICYDSYEDKKITIKLLDDVTLNISEDIVGIRKLHGGGDIKIRSTDTWGGILTINMLNPDNHGSLEDGVRVFTDFKTTSNAPLRNGARLANIENRPVVCEFHVPHTNFYLVDTTLQAYSMTGEKLHLEGDYIRYWADSNHKIVCDGFLTNKNIDFFQLKIDGTTVTNLNRKDVLGDGSVKVSYEYSENLREMATYVHLYGDKMYAYHNNEPFIDGEGNLIVVSHGHVALSGENTFLRHHDGHYCELTGDLMTLCEYEKPFLLGADYSTSINMKYLRWYPRDSKNNNTAVAFTALRHGSETEETIFFGGTSENNLRFTIEGKPSANVKFESTSALGIYDLKSNNPLEYYDGQMWVVNEVSGSRISPATGAAIRVKKKSYGIVLGGTEVITEDEQYARIPVGNGTAIYNPTYNELTLNNVDIDCTNACGIEVLLGAAKEDLTICLNGKNTIHATGKGVSGIRVPGKLTFTGTGTLYVSASDGKAGIEAQEVFLKTSGTNAGCNIRSHGAEYGVYTNSNLRVDNYCRLVAGCTNVNQGTAAIRTPGVTLGSNVSMTYNSQPCHVDNAQTAVVDNQSRIVRGDVVVGLTEFNIWVCGIAVTMDNMNDVRGDGTVSYDPAENVLTLRGANLPAVTDHMSRRSTIWSYGSLIVKIEGTNTLNAGIRTGGHLTLTGQGENDSLSIHVESNDSWNAIQCYGLTIEDCKLEAVQPGTSSYAASYVISSGSQMPVVLRDCWLNVRNAKPNGRDFENYDMNDYDVNGIVVDEGDIAGRTATLVAHPAEHSYYSIIANPQSMGSVFGYVNSNETHCTWEDMSYGYKGIETYIGTNIVVKAEPRDESIKFEGWWMEGSSMLVSTEPELHLTCDLPYMSLVARFAPAEQEEDIHEDIQNIDTPVKVTKCIQNGQLLIIRDDKAYDIMGRRVY